VSWIEALSGGRADREEALERLHALLLRASRFEIARRRRTLGGGRASVCDDLALQAATRSWRFWASCTPSAGTAGSRRGPTSSRC
jgi:hypothetical protein